MNEERRNIALIYGIITGAGMLILMTILYRIGVYAYMGKWSYLGYAWLITMAIMATIAQRRIFDGYLEFQEALKTCFTVFVIALAAQTIFIWVLMNYLDYKFKDQVNRVSIQRTEDVLRSIGMPQDKLDQILIEMRNTDSFAFKRMLTGLMVMYIVFFIISLIIAFILKRKRPQFTDAGI